MTTTKTTGTTNGYYYARSDTRNFGCVHRHRTEAAARKCAKGMRCPAHTVFINLATTADR